MRNTSKNGLTLLSLLLLLITGGIALSVCSGFYYATTQNQIGEYLFGFGVNLTVITPIVLMLHQARFNWKPILTACCALWVVIHVGLVVSPYAESLFGKVFVSASLMGALFSGFYRVLGDRMKARSAGSESVN